MKFLFGIMESFTTDNDNKLVNVIHLAVFM